MPSIFGFFLIASARISIPSTKSVPDSGQPCRTPRSRLKKSEAKPLFVTQLVMLQYNVCTQCLKSVKSFKKEVPFYGIKCLFKVEENSNTGQVFCCGVTNNVTNESYVFTDVPSFDITGLISVYHKRQNGFQSFCDCFRGNFVVCV